MSDKRLRIPAYLHRDAQEIFNLTDSFCAEHLDAEYAGLCPKLVARLARKRPSPLARGDLRIWAGAGEILEGRRRLGIRLHDPHGTPLLSKLAESRLGPR
jgi:hypothetical protein